VGVYRDRRCVFKRRRRSETTPSSLKKRCENGGSSLARGASVCYLCFPGLHGCLTRPWVPSAAEGMVCCEGFSIGIRFVQQLRPSHAGVRQLGQVPFPPAPWFHCVARLQRQSIIHFCTASEWPRVWRPAGRVPLRVAQSLRYVGLVGAYQRICSLSRPIARCSTPLVGYRPHTQVDPNLFPSTSTFSSCPSK